MLEATACDPQVKDPSARLTCGFVFQEQPTSRAARPHCPTAARRHKPSPGRGSVPRPPRPAPAQIFTRRDHPPDEMANLVSESESTGFVNDLVRLQAGAAGDDFFLDLGDAAEDRLWAAVARLGSWRARETRSSWWPCTGRTGSLSRPVGGLVQVGQVAADADAGLGCPSGKRRTGRSDMSSRFLRAGNVKLTRRLPGGREW